MTMVIPDILTGTYAQRIAYDTTNTLWDAFWYQTDTVDTGGGVMSFSGYYQWNLGTSSAGWNYISTPNRMNFNGRISAYNDAIVVRSDDNTASIFMISGLGTTYKATQLILGHDNHTREIQWIIGKSGDSNGDLNFDLWSGGVYSSTPFNIQRSTGSVSIALRLNVGYILDAQKKFYLSGDLTPPQITADQNDYDPTGEDNASIYRLSSDAARNITGLVGGVDGRVLNLCNVGGFAITLKNASGLSAAQNRFGIGADIVLAASGGGCTLWYDATSALWRCVGKN